MPTGEGLTPDQQHEIGRAVTTANVETGLLFSVFVGAAEGDPRHFAERLHAALGVRAPAAVLIMVDPDACLVEIVTGRESARRLSDRSCGLAALSMSSSFGGGDLTGGITQGLRMLSEAAGHPALTSGSR